MNCFRVDGITDYVIIERHYANTLNHHADETLLGLVTDMTSNILHTLILIIYCISRLYCLRNRSIVISI